MNWKFWRKPKPKSKVKLAYVKETDFGFKPCTIDLGPGMIEILGPAGKVVILNQDWPKYQVQGYKILGPYIPQILRKGLEKLREDPSIPREHNIIHQPIDPRAAKFCRVCGQTEMNEKCAYCMKERQPYRRNIANSNSKNMVLVDGQWFNMRWGGRRER